MTTYTWKDLYDRYIAFCQTCIEVPEECNFCNLAKFMEQLEQESKNGQFESTQETQR